jgi:2-keto-4-pentenoate hydratase/2-oxohepta-3-ene-1,7-dioic acid hydratase in catechol pathway
MRLGTIRAAGRTTAAVQDDAGWTLIDAGDVAGLVSRGDWRDQVRKALASPSPSWLPHDEVEVLRPILAPAKVICCGLNYRDHIAETQREIPEYPTLFAKYADTITDPTAPIDAAGSDRVDWEAELAVVVGRSCPAGGPIDGEAILGYTVANDVSMRDWQSRTLQWFQGKAWDRTTPLGPVIVTADAIDPKSGLEIGTRIDDDVVQISNTRELLFDSLALLSYVTSFTSLSPGDIILTGTPGGVGLGRTPQRFLRDGEVLTTWIEGIGELSNLICVAKRK